MHTFEHTVEIAAPIENVFQWSIDPENWQRSMPSLARVEVTEETDDGMQMEVTYRMLGRSIEGDMEFEILEPEAHTVSAFESPGMTGELHYRFEETDSGTRIVQSCEYEFGDSLLERIIEPVAARYNRRQFKNSLVTTKELIEAEVAEAGDDASAGDTAEDEMVAKGGA